MILAKGKVFDSNEQDAILARLEDEINLTRKNKSLSVEKVINAIDCLGKAIADGEFDSLIQALDIDGIEKYIAVLIQLLSRESIAFKIKTELGESFFDSYETNPPIGTGKITVKSMPLGTLFHIVAGNVDGLPAFSVAEGLLTGNVNILKLPQADNGLSLQIILKLIEIEPDISDFIYVFDTSSSDIMAMKKMAELSDGIVVWGGDIAVRAVRQFAPVGAKLIEWGHKLGFAYISGYEDKAQELTALAEHILSTKQLLCSSCQTIFLDTDSMDDVYDFCADFLPYMEAAALKYPFGSIGSAAEITLRNYNDLIENILSGNVRSTDRVFKGGRCTLTACADKKLALSAMFGNCLVKRLPKDEIFIEIRKHKGYLQTVGLICPSDERGILTDLFARCGLVRITKAGHMSETFAGEAHDGEYSLRRYVRIVNCE